MSEICDYEKTAMLELSSPERETLKERFDTIKNGFSALDRYDTSEVEPLVTVLDVCNVIREDISEKIIQREELLKNAPEQSDGYFRVPATID